MTETQDQITEDAQAFLQFIKDQYKLLHNYDISDDLANLIVKTFEAGAESGYFHGTGKLLPRSDESFGSA